MPKLVAARQFRLSGGRVYQPGDTFEVKTEAQARLLVAIGKADREAHEASEIAERDVLRQQAEALGVNVDGRWGVDRLQDEIADAQRRRQATYQRRDMVAEDPQAAPTNGTTTAPTPPATTTTK